VFDAMYADSGIRLAELRVDGGMVRNELLMQFQADILGVPVVRPVIQETTSLGAAYAAGMAVGFWSGPEQIRQYWKEDKRWLPKMDPETREKLYAGWKKAVERSFGWVEF
jgi:glycerol kinase